MSVPPDEALQAISSLQTLLPHLGYRGVFCAEFKQDERDGLFKLLEVNVRPWWFVDFAALSGIDVCAMAYRYALDLEVEPNFSSTPGRRHMIFTTHLRALRKLRSEGKLTLRK